MIVPMVKYSFVLYHKEYEGFLEKLQGLGLVDITIADWEPDDTERQMVSSIEQIRRAVIALSAVVKNKDEAREVVPYPSAEEALREYIGAAEELNKLQSERNRLEKEIADTIPWGEFSPVEINCLKYNGVDLHFFTKPTKEFQTEIDVWNQEYIIEEINEIRGITYFVVIGKDGEPIRIDAVEVKTPEGTVEERKEQIAVLDELIERQNDIILRASGNVEDLKTLEQQLKEDLHLSQTKTTASKVADDTLVILEGWAPVEDQDNVDRMIEDGSVFALKEEPQEEDDPPVLLKNNRFARLFEVIGNLYSLPKYGTVDFTPYFAPFYMIFFGFCLADAGYGILYVIASLVGLAKLPEKYKPFAKLALYCGLATIFFGFISGNMFGIQLPELGIFSNYKEFFLTPDSMFMLAIGVGIFHILYAMTLKIIFTSKLKGFRYSLGSLGWLIVILSGLAAYLLPDFGIAGYDFSSVPFWIVTGIGLFLMLFMNTPGKNIFVNFGSGLWNTYNNVTGLLSDVLSYIRLFALGLSGGILALVFNKLAMDMAPAVPVLRQLVMIIIILFGQGLTMFMASLSAFVHPLRLTFVEFYNNAGFVDGGRAFNPLKKEIKN
ncbi:MAG: V-type ATP synthase subunit I [Rikenellaceae bacterium]|nr:V-type ATP synthase subunit I [Rikenellaceae bacterium]